MGRVKSVFRCTSCGYSCPRWMGRCPGCEAWNTLVEETIEPEPKSGAHARRTFRLPESDRTPKERTPNDPPPKEVARNPVPLSSLRTTDIERMPTGMKELDRVLGGGLVPGALILVGGDPGIGKSTLLLHGLDHIAKAGRGRVLYVTGEESLEQVKLRADRLGVVSDQLHLFAETRADRIAQAVEEAAPAALVVDSIQAVYDPDLESAPGSVSQIREVAARFLYLAKARGVPTFLVGHVTKDGALAGPRVLEHMVDTVLYFESSTGHPYRILRAHKNRFGSTNEIGVFEMEGHGLREVANPSELFLAERPEDAPGSVVMAAIEGTRPVLVEVQALVSPTSFGTPRRTCLGFDSARAALLVAVLERRAGLDLLGCDVFVNIAGGLAVQEPAADLAVSLALASSFKNRPVARSLVAFGEVGLAGEIRAIQQAEARLMEAAKLGFKRAVMPAASTRRLRAVEGMEVIAAKTLESALESALSG